MYVHFPVVASSYSVLHIKCQLSFMVLYNAKKTGHTCSRFSTIFVCCFFLWLICKCNNSHINSRKDHHYHEADDNDGTDVDTNVSVCRPYLHPTVDCFGVSGILQDYKFSQIVVCDLFIQHSPHICGLCFSFTRRRHQHQRE